MLFEGKQKLEGPLKENAIDGTGHDRNGKPLTWTAHRIIAAAATPPAPAKKHTDFAKLGGSVWKVYSDTARISTYKHSADGTLASPDGKLLNKSRWCSPSKKLLRFSLNGDYAMYEGKLIDANTLIGTAGNGRSEWSWMAMRLIGDE